MISVRLASDSDTRWAQQQVAEHHYLHAPVDPRCSPLTYVVTLYDRRIGCLIFGRPEATRCYPWYGSVEDMQTGKARLSRWEIINLARVWLHPDVQRGGRWFESEVLPGFGFVDRRGVWRSRLASTVIGLALDRIVADYLVAHPPCFLDEPWQLREVLSYCDTSKHTGTIYRAAGFTLLRENERGIQTYVRRLRSLGISEYQHIERIAEQSPRSRLYRSRRAVAGITQPLLVELESSS